MLYLQTVSYICLSVCYNVDALSSLVGLLCFSTDFLAPLMLPCRRRSFDAAAAAVTVTPRMLPCCRRRQSSPGVAADPAVMILPLDFPLD